MSCTKPWVLFDADNTLWDVEHLYDHARSALCQFMGTRGCQQESVEAFQRARDAQLYRSYGYSACRFARSFEDTVRHFLPSASDADIRDARRLATDVFDAKATPAEGLESILKSLVEVDFVLGIVTAGERWVQRQRISDFHLRDSFAAVEIVEVKDRGVFEQFIMTYEVDAARSWVVGDSVRSDILPARSAGLNTVLLNTHNWLPVEGESHGLPADVPIIDDLRQLLGVPGLLAR